MKIVTMYEAEDGTHFSNEKQCVDVIEANAVLANGSSLLDVLKHANRSWTDWGKNLPREDKEILSKITTDTGISVEYWQCESGCGRFWANLALW